MVYPAGKNDGSEFGQNRVLRALRRFIAWMPRHRVGDQPRRARESAAPLKLAMSSVSQSASEVRRNSASISSSLQPSAHVQYVGQSYASGPVSQTVCGLSHLGPVVHVSVAAFARGSALIDEFISQSS